MNKELFVALGKCRIIEKKLVFTIFELTEEELEGYLSKKLLSKQIVEKETDTKEYYTLTEKGEKALKELAPSFGEIYRGFILEHDIALMEFYLKRTTQEQDTWLTRDDMIKKYQFPGTLDGAFINQEGKFEGVEALSVKAKYSSVEKAEAFIKEVNIEEMNYLIY